MQLPDLTGLTDAELDTLHTEALAALSRGLNATTYSVGPRSLSRASPQQVMNVLAAVKKARRMRSNSQDGGVDLACF